MNLNVNRPEIAQEQAQAPAADEAVNAEQRETADGENDQQQQGNSETEPLAAPAEPTAPEEPQVPLLTIVRTFVLSFFSSIIPEAPAL